MDKIYYYFHKANPAIEKNADDLKYLRFFRHQRKKSGENGYDYPVSSTKESDIYNDVGPGYDLDDSEKCSNTERDKDRDNGTLIRKILHAFKR